MFRKIRRPVMQFSGDWQEDRFRLVMALQKDDDGLEQPGALHLSEFALDTTSTTPTVTAGSGTLTTATSAVEGQVVGNRFEFTATVTITTNGTGATDIRLALPYSAAEITGLCGYKAGVSLAAAVSTAGLVVITNYDGTYPGADGAVLRISGSYRKA
jgi:hypothetical protein